MGTSPSHRQSDRPVSMNVKTATNTIKFYGKHSQQRPLLHHTKINLVRNTTSFAKTSTSTPRQQQYDMKNDRTFSFTQIHRKYFYCTHDCSRPRKIEVLNLRYTQRIVIRFLHDIAVRNILLKTLPPRKNKIHEKKRHDTAQKKERKRKNNSVMQKVTACKYVYFVFSKRYLKRKGIRIQP